MREYPASTTRHGVGSNQYQKRPAAAGRQPSPPGARRCGALWGGRCQTWVSGPSWSHGNHPSTAATRRMLMGAEALGLSRLSPDIIAALAASPDPETRALLVRAMEKMTADQLRVWQHDPSPTVRAEVASRTDIPADVVSELLRDESSLVRRKLILNPYACVPESALQEMLDRGDTALRHMWHPVAHDDHSVLAQVSNLNRRFPLDPDSLEKLSDNDAAWVRQLVAGNPGTTPEILFKLAFDEDDLVRESVSMCNNAPPWALRHIYVTDGPSRWLARNPNTPSDILTEWALNSQDPQALIYNPSVPMETLRIALSRFNLGRNDREDLASHPQAPPEILEKLGRSKEPAVRRKVAENPSTPPKVLASLARDAFPTIRLLTASHPSTPAKALAWLAKDGNDAIGAAVRAHPDVPPEALDALARKPYSYDERCKAIDHPRTTEETLMSIALDDPIPGIRQAAWDRLPEHLQLMVILGENQD